MSDSHLGSKGWLRLLLEPVARFCLRRSFKIQEILEALKEALVSSAESEMLASGLKPTVNRISIMTGIHRSDVQRLLSEEGGNKNTVNIINRVIGAWQNDQRFINSRRQARILTFDGKVGEFADLVSSVTADLNPYTVLFELERLGAIKKTDRGVQLIAHELIIRADTAAALAHLAKDSGDLHAAVEENIFENDPLPNLHLRTEFDNISSSKLPRIRRWLLKEGTAFHRRANRFLAAFDRDLSKSEISDADRARVSLCSFSYTSSPKVREDIENG